MFQKQPQITFTNLNSLIKKQATHTIRSIKPSDKNLQIKFVILQEIEKITTKKGTIYKFLIADHTASVEINIFDEVGAALSGGDVCYMNGGYCSVFRERLLLYQGKQCLFKRLGRFRFFFDERINMSREQVKMEVEEERSREKERGRGMAMGMGREEWRGGRDRGSGSSSRSGSEGWRGNQRSEGRKS